MADYALLRLGYVLSLQNKADEAGKKFDELLTRFPNSKHAPTAIMSAGQAMFRAERWDDAATQFKKLLSKSETRSAEAVHWLAMTLTRHNKSAERNSGS